MSFSTDKQIELNEQILTKLLEKKLLEKRASDLKREIEALQREMQLTLKSELDRADAEKREAANRTPVQGQN